MEELIECENHFKCGIEYRVKLINISDFTYAVNINKYTITIIEYTGKGGSVEIPAVIDGKLVTGIANNAFQNCDGLTSVTIPDSVTKIWCAVFSDCTKLSSVTLGNSVTYIGDHAFRGCTSFTSVTIPNSVTSIGDYAFALCENLTGITIPNSVKKIGDHAFRGCTSLTSVTIGNSITTIKKLAFYGCARLTSVTFERANTAIVNDNSFPYGSSLRTAYTAGGKGTYTRASGRDNWKKVLNKSF